MIRNQLLNLYYDPPPTHPFAFHLPGVHRHLVAWAAEESDASCHRVTVFAKSGQGGLTRTRWEHQRLFDVDGRSVVSNHRDERYPPRTWTKIKADLHHRDEIVSLTVYRRRVQLQGQLARPWTDDAFRALFARGLPRGTELASPRIALVVFHSTTGLPALARIDVPSVCEETTNPRLATPNTQRITRDHRDRPFLRIQPTTTADWRLEIRVGSGPLFHITYTRGSAARTTDPNLFPRLWDDASGTAARVANYLTDHLRTGTLMTQSAPSYAHKNCALRRLPKLDGKTYQEYTSAQLRDLYHARRAGASPPTPPRGFVWQRKSKKLFLFLCLVGMIPLDHTQNLLDDFVRPSSSSSS